MSILHKLLNFRNRKRSQYSYEYFNLKKKNRKNNASCIYDNFKSSNCRIKDPTYLSIRFRQNNIFCFIGSLISLKGEPVVKLSGGTMKLNISKKNLKYNSKIVIQQFFDRIPIRLTKRVVLVSLIIPRTLKRRILLLLIRRVTKFNCTAIFWVNGKKCFNGCRVPKQKRKKRHKYKIFK